MTVSTGRIRVAALVVEVQRAVAADDIPPSARFREWATAAWLGAERAAEVVVRVTGEAESRRLNRDFRGKDRPTNVLSFANDPVPGIDEQHAGDLVICAPVVRREAAEQGKAVDAHWAHMVVHGMLHLQGYDHETDDDADVMETLETKILAGLGFPAPYADDERP